MIHFALIVILVIVAAVSLFDPWVGAVAGYLFSVLTPQAIWYWDFYGVRPVLWITFPTALGLLFAIARRSVDLRVLWNRRNLGLLILWLFCVLSYYFGPYTHVGGQYRFENADFRLDDLNKIFTLYFMACACIDRERRLKALYLVMIGAGLYLTYWANDQYLTGNYFGRLEGPSMPDGSGMYKDQNAFAMLFVVAQPFIWYWGASFTRPLLKWTIWLAIPFCWHAVFLTGSRGGLLGLAATIILIVARSKRKILGLALLPAFVFVFVWQGGSVMKSRADTISGYSQDASAEERLSSWHAAWRMIEHNPLVGVGLASYGPAFPHYSSDTPREAHNTLLQITAESGVVAGLMYLYVLGDCLFSLWRNGNRLRGEGAEVSSNFALRLNESVFISFAGLAVCSAFLSLQDFEVFYCLAVLANGTLLLAEAKRAGGDGAVVTEAINPVRKSLVASVLSRRRPYSGAPIQVRWRHDRRP